MAFEAELEVAIQAVEKAARLCREVRHASPIQKEDRSPVTVADYGAQAVVAHQLAVAYPDDPLVGEEDAAALRGEACREIRGRVVEHVQALLPSLSEEQILAAIDRGCAPGGPTGRHWTLDPIDGTKGFLRNEQYAVALALIQNGQVMVGVLACPNLPVDAAEPDGPHGCLFTAVRGQGATLRPLDGGKSRPVSVNAVTDPAFASFCESVESGHSSHDHHAQIAELLGVTAAPTRMDSQAKYGAVARGDAAIYLRLPVSATYQEKIWDHAAGWLIITEAGGAVTDVTGAPLDFSVGRTLVRNSGVVATNGHLRAPVMAAVRQVLGIPPQ